jgi:hypothetical protein
MLATRPSVTGSSAVLNTIGITVLVALAARAAGVFAAIMTAGERLTSSDTNCGSSS